MATTNDFDAYAVNIDPACITADFDVADDMQYQLEQIAKNDCDIQFE